MYILDIEFKCSKWEYYIFYVYYDELLLFPDLNRGTNFLLNLINDHAASSNIP